MELGGAVIKAIIQRRSDGSNWNSSTLLWFENTYVALKKFFVGGGSGG